MKVLGIIGILIAVLIVGFLATKTLGSLNNGGVKAPLDQAEDVKAAAELKALETKLNLYFQDNGHYPASLNELDNYGLNSNTFKYRLCSPTQIVVETGNHRLALDSGSETNTVS